MTSNLTERQRELISHLPATCSELADALGVADSTVKGHVKCARDNGADIVYHESTGDYHLADDVAADSDKDTPDADTAENSSAELDALADTLDAVDAEADEPNESGLTEREEYIARKLQQGTTPETLADELGERESVITQHLRDLKREGWQVYIDDDAEHVAIEGDHTLRSSEHTGTRTRKANQWWELRHNELVREFEALDPPTADYDATAGREDWVLHLTDLHAGDRVRRDDGVVVYETDAIPDIIDYTTEQALALADKHNSTYDAAHLLWGGDFVTNEGIYEGQFEDLDAWLDEQVDTLHGPLLRQLKTFADRFETVNVVANTGNHGEMRASGTSRQANADLLVYKSIRNTVAALQDHAGMLQNVNFDIGQARPHKNFDLRGGRLNGHLRHGQDRRPQAETSARKKEWLSTLLDHDFDIAYLGHHHISGRIPWSGPPIIASPSPKPGGEFVERLGAKVPSEFQGVATAHGVSDDGITSVFPIDTRNYQNPRDDWQWGESVND